MDPLVSIVMAVYNGEKYLIETLKSLTNQNYKNIEIIIIDDCSSDHTEQIIKSYHDKRVIYYRNEKNMKLAYSLNKGISVAKGKYIARMDADDLCAPNRLNVQVAYLERHPEIDILGGNYKAFGNSHHSSNYPISHSEIRTTMLFENPLCHPTVMFRKDTIIEWYDGTCWAGQDYELWSRLIFKNKFHNLKDEILYYRVHEGQTLRVMGDLQKRGAMIARRRMFGNTSIQESDIDFLVEFCTSSTCENLSELKHGCRLLEEIQRETDWIDVSVYKRYINRIVWDKVVHNSSGKEGKRLMEYAMLNYGAYIFTNPKIVWKIIRNKLVK